MSSQGPPSERQQEAGATGEASSDESPGAAGGTEPAPPAVVASETEALPPTSVASDAAARPPPAERGARALWRRAGTWIDRVRAVLLPLVLAGGAGFFAWFVNGHYPVKHWLFWHYAGYWLATLTWAASCVAVGHVTVKKFLLRSLPFAEHVTLSFGVGVFGFFLAMFALGALHQFGKALFYLLPAAFLAAAGWPTLRYFRRYARLRAAARRRGGGARWWVPLVVLFGIVGFALVYFSILTPDNAQFDSRWKHIALAEEYVAHGGIRRSDEGCTVLTFPHLASFLYAWAFLSPGNLFDHVEMAAHVEFACFAASVLGIVSVVRLVVPKTHGELGWAARFLFPGVFLYDSSVSLGADHVAALFVPPMFTLMIRAYERLAPRLMVFLVAMLSGGVLVKYTSSMMLAPVPALVLGFRSVTLGVQSLRGRITGLDRRNWYLAPLVGIAAGLVLTSPHWLKNLIWYRDPLYPSLHAYIRPNPWTQDAADVFEYGYKEYQFWRPERSWAGLKETLKALVNFSFIPNDYPRYHGKVPVFGSLFTLSFVALPFVKGTRRLWGLFATVHVSIFIWYWTHHQDRYLQTLMPWMAAATAAVVVLAWRAHIVAKLALVALLALQIVWGGDVYLIPGHAMIKSPVKRVIDLLSAGYHKDYAGRFKIFGAYPEVAKVLPKNARVLLHDNHVHAGIGHTSVSDWGGWQFGISYGRQKSSRDVYELLKGLHVTHVLWDNQVSKGWDSIAGDLMFFEFVIKFGAEPKRFGGSTLVKMPDNPPPEATNDTVLFLGCNREYRAGLYHVADLTVPVFGPKRKRFPPPFRAGPPSGETAEALVEAAGYAVVDPKCGKLPDAGRGFVLGARRKGVNALPTLELWVRATAPASTAPSTPTPAPGADDDDDEQGP